MQAQIAAVQSKARADSLSLVAQIQVARLHAAPLGTMIASFIRPDANDGFMEGDSTWALADGTLPTGTSYTGVFPDLRGQFLFRMPCGKRGACARPRIPAGTC